MQRIEKILNRRHFISKGIRGAGVLALGSSALTISKYQSRAANSESANAFAYDVETFSAIDPKLIKYQSVRTISGLHPEPRRLAMGPDDHLYVATKIGVQVLDREGNLLSDLPTTSATRCVAVADDGIVYAGTRSHVEVFDATGTALATWDSPNRKTWLTGLCVGPHDIFLADAANRVILRYDRSGKFQGRIGEKDPEHNIAGLIVPSPYLDVKLGRDGLLRVNNPGRHRVEVFTPNGELEFFWGRPSAAIDGFCGCCNPIGLAMLSDGRCVTCEKGLPRVKVFSEQRMFDGVVAGPELFRQNARAGQLSVSTDGTVGGLDAVADSKGNIYILDLVAGDVRVMKPKA